MKTASGRDFEKKLADVLLERGLCERSALDAALTIRKQKNEDKSLLDCLLELELITPAQARRLSDELCPNKKNTQPPEVPGYDIREISQQNERVSIWQAHQQSVDREVLLKVLPKGSFSDHGAEERFRQEGKLLASLNHRHISGAIDMGETEECLYLVLHQFRGRRLSEILAESSPLPAEQTIAIGAYISDALCHMHGKGIAHGNLCPENIIVTEDGHALLCGFETICEEGPWQPGKQARYHFRDFDKQTWCACDIFALGCTLFTCATGVDPLALPEFKDNLSRPIPCKFNLRIGQRMGGIIYTAMNTLPRRGYKSAEQMHKDLLYIAEGQKPLTAETMPGLWGKSLPSLPAWPTSRAGVAALIVTAGLLGLLLGAYASYSAHTEMFFGEELSREARAQEHWRESRFPTTATPPARALWQEAQRMTAGGVAKPGEIEFLYRKLIREYPGSAYGQAALERLKRLKDNE